MGAKSHEIRGYGATFTCFRRCLGGCGVRGEGVSEGLKLKSVILKSD